MNDLISRQAAIDAVDKYIDKFDCIDADFLDGLKTAKKLMMQMPSAQRTGRWIWDDEGYHCSECWYHAYGNTAECFDGTYKFCPNCGARMRGEEE